MLSSHLTASFDGICEFSSRPMRRDNQCAVVQLSQWPKCLSILRQIDDSGTVIFPPQPASGEWETEHADGKIDMEKNDCGEWSLL